jgi:hypothetical protein
VRLTAIAVLLACTAPALAGPLDPPPGPVQSTFKTLTQVEPRIEINATNTPGDADSLYKITQPGSYYLTGNITGVVGKHGIEIASSGVTIDLSGFDLVGAPAMGNFDGISATVALLTNIAVLNGSVRNWGDKGIDLGSFPVTNCRVSDVFASGCTGFGISSGVATTLSNCSASQNTGGGINIGVGSNAINCSAYNNASNGIIIGFGSTASNCSAYANVGSGIVTGNSSTVSGCSAYDNDANGISAGSGSTVTHNAVRFNSSDGILCGSQSLILGNTCSFNGQAGVGAGIRVTNFDNRIEGNNCIGADTGIKVDSAGNIIIRNSCSGNTINWDIVGNNIYGPILDRTAPVSSSVSGNAAASTLGSTDPNANFTY